MWKLPLVISGQFPQRLQRAAPGDHLVKHSVDCLLLLGGRLEDAKVLEVREEREPNLRFDVGNLQFRHDRAQR